MAKVGFEIDVYVKDPANLAEIQARINKMAVVFENIIDEWATGNARKFNLGKGREMTGAVLDNDVLWVPLTEPYRKRKRAMGQEDWLMQATGQLRATMTNKDGFLRYVDDMSAAWGRPMSKEDEDKLRGNAHLRQVVFFDRGDRLAIKREVANYVKFGDKYRDILFAQGLQTKSARKQMNIWDAEWKDLFNA
jgi:hypothetical protein